ncbi:acyltransferase [Serratia marcescens]|uniref:acyltransferase family protein n=1 Tax=Serratia marcescens TaxID=615 RepID=UPI0013EE9CDE|nr:acyltransferase [Serratia marcescens]BEN10366.1 acyltransferase [Serratia marcescens]
MKRYTVLDSFRGICALCVALHHLNVTGSITEWAIFRNSTYMVEFFFILSGFVLTHSYFSRDFNKITLANFVISRSFRLFPLHIIMLLVFLLFEFGKLAAQNYGFYFNKPAFTELSAPTEFIPNLLLLQSWIPSAESLSFNYPSWSISVEYYLYLVFGGVLFFSNDRKSIAIALFALLSVWGFYSLLSHNLLLKDDAFRGISCFFFGSLIYFIHSRIANININKYVASLLEMAIILACFFCMTLPIENKGVTVSILYGLAIIIFSGEFGIFSSLLKSTFFQNLGKHSFSIYMTHAAIIFLMVSGAMILSKLLGVELSYSQTNPYGNPIRYINLGNATINNILVFCFLAVILFVSKLSYDSIEKRSIRYGKKCQINHTVQNDTNQQSTQ